MEIRFYRRVLKLILHSDLLLFKERVIKIQLHSQVGSFAFLSLFLSVEDRIGTCLFYYPSYCEKSVDISDIIFFSSGIKNTLFK